MTLTAVFLSHVSPINQTATKATFALFCWLLQCLCYARLSMDFIHTMTAIRYHSPTKPTGV
jgi:hypothetical protein